MKQYEQHIWNLLTRILSGEANRSEEEEFTRWLEKDQANRAFFENLQSHWKEEPDKNTVYNRFLFDHESGISKLRYKLREEKKDNVLQRSSPPRVNRSKKFTGWKAAASILLIMGIISTWTGTHFWTPSVTSYATSNVEQQMVTLPDGTRVRLNKNSKISFKKDFSEFSRTVTLNGEAFFDVKHKSDKPFIIHAGNAVVRDIGTSFNIKQQENGKIVVAMKEGEAVLQAKDSSNKEAKILTKNQIGILNKGQIITDKQENIKNYLSWIQGRLEFDNMRLGKVIRQLDNIYDIHSSLADSSLSALKLTAYINDTSLGKVLDMIALSLDIGYRKKGNNVTWKKETAQTKAQPKNISDTTITKD